MARPPHRALLCAGSLLSAAFAFASPPGGGNATGLALKLDSAFALMPDQPGKAVPLILATATPPLPLRLDAATFPADPPEATSVVVAVTLNSEPKGDFFIFVTADGDYLVKPSDLEAMGIRGARGETLQVEGEAYLSLRSVRELDVRFDEMKLTLAIVSAPALLEKKSVDLLPQRRPNVLKPRDNSAFLNYRLGYAGSDSGTNAFNLSAELGMRLSDYLFLTDFSHVDADSERRTVRLMSSLTRDWREDLQRLRLGDFFTSSGELGSTLNLGGVSFSKRYTIDPYLIKQPMAGLAGAVALPSEAEIYLDGIRVRTEKLAPGGFQIQNLNYYGGARDIEIVIKDRFGREQRIAYRYYFADTLLREGLHEYSYDLGFLRQDFGMESNRYGELAASAFHRYGMSDSLTVGLRGEAGGSRLNFGPQAVLRLGDMGTASASLSASRDRDAGNGLAVQLGYGYQARSFNARLLARGFSEDYALAGATATADRPKQEASAGIGYGTRKIGNFGADYTVSTRYQGTERRAATLTYSRSFFGNFNLFATFSRVREETAGNAVFVGLAYYPGRDITASYLHQDRAGSHSDTLQMGKNAPVGEGWGYRVALDNQRSASTDMNSVSPYLQYNGKYGIYTADYRSQSVEAAGRSASYQVSAAGAVGYVGGAFGFSRPLYDSFGRVKVGEIESVRVSQNNQVIGKTDSSGELFVPNLGSYIDNQISINDNDIPIEYAISEKEKYVSPPLRSGSLIKFEVTRIQAFGGMLKIRVDGETKPVEYYEITLHGDGKPLVFPTGKGGEFYLENLKPGTYPATFGYAGKICAFDLAIPESKEMIVELGEVVCEKIR